MVRFIGNLRSVEHCVPRPATEDYFPVMVDSFPVLVAVSTLLIMGTARAQVSAPNCSDSSIAWVGPPPQINA